MTNLLTNLLGGFGGVVNDIIIGQTSHGFNVGNVVYNNAGTYTLAIATGALTTDVVGVVVEASGANSFVLQSFGFTFLPSWQLQGGAGPLDGSSQYYLSATVAGTIVAVQPTAPNFVSPILRSHTATTGDIDLQLSVVGVVA